MADRFSAGLEREWHASATVFFNDPTHFLFCMPSLAFITQQFAISSDCKVLRVWFLEDIISLFLLFFFHIQHFTQRIKMKCQRKKFQRNFLWKGKKKANWMKSWLGVVQRAMSETFAMFWENRQRQFEACNKKQHPILMVIHFLYSPSFFFFFLFWVNNNT